MKANTRLFGEIEINDEKLITLEQGIIGFPHMKHFALIYDAEKKGEDKIKWLQSMDDPEFAMPVMDPGIVKDDYAPEVSNEMVEQIGGLTEENTFILVTLTVPSDIEKMTVNLKAPFVINSDTNKGFQMIVENDYPVKYPIYDILKARKEKAGE